MIVISFSSWHHHIYGPTIHFIFYFQKSGIWVKFMAAEYLKIPLFYAHALESTKLKSLCFLLVCVCVREIVTVISSISKQMGTPCKWLILSGSFHLQSLLSRKWACTHQERVVINDVKSKKISIFGLPYRRTTFIIASTFILPALGQCRLKHSSTFGSTVCTCTSDWDIL